ncbi:MAG: GNAT family N-acetyltransferase [Robiginitalea sp.]
MQVDIRIATPEDLPVLRSFEQGLIRDERPFDPTIRPDPVHYYDLDHLINDPAARLVVAVYRDVIIASGYAIRKTPRQYLDHDAYAYFGFMYTRPEYRGLGINGKIVEYLRIWAREQGLCEIRLTVYTENQPAIRAYQKSGFEPHIIEMRVRDEPLES